MNAKTAETFDSLARYVQNYMTESGNPNQDGIPARYRSYEIYFFRKLTYEALHWNGDRGRVG